MADTLKNRLVNSLVESLNIPQKDIEAAIALQKSKGITLDKALVEKGIINEEDLLVLLVKELHIPFINLKKYKIDPALKDVIPERVARQYRIVPLSRLERTITIAIADPLNIFAIDDIKSITGQDIDVVMSTDTDILKAIDNFYGTRASSSMKEISREIAAGDLEVISQSDGGPGMDINVDDAEQAPIIRLVNLFIQEALKQRASDIHIEPMIDCARVRYRIDGVLQEVMKIPRENQSAVLVRIKIMSRLDITATRTPQDGRFKMRIGHQEVDFRVSLLPTTFGQKVVLRILDKKNLKIGLESLGLSTRSIQLLDEAVVQPFGMILVTGPTGSGKSTTLYSIVNKLNTVDKNIITVEDPVEYLIEGLTQIQVRPEVGLTFASGLKAILRQSPDIVMVGEIRDFETADIAIKAALTGQLVFSTLHTNDAAGSLTRLVDMGVEPFLVASSLILACAQRLCRRICPNCKAPEDVPAAVRGKLPHKLPPDTVAYKGKGCASCRQTGYLGRVAVTEILKVDDAVREMLMRGSSADKIRDHARKAQGMTLLWDDMMDKFIKGETSLEEVFRISSKE